MTALTEVPADVSDDTSMAVYAHVVQRGSVTIGDPQLSADLGLTPEVVASSLARLLDLHLLRGEPENGWRHLVPVSPEVAAASLISPIGEEINRRRALISQIQARLNLFQPYYEANRDTSSARARIEALTNEIELSGHLHLAAEQCGRDFVGFRPDGLLALARIAAMARRGVTVRLLVQHSLRTDLRARAAMKEIVALGGEVRTVGQLPRQVIIFDDEVAFLLGDRGSGPTGVAIRHQETVRLLREVVEMTWATAEPYSAGDIGYHEVTDDLLRTIVELLASGLTDEAIARRLGVSVRTCRRHIATVLNSLDAVSRFQAGALAVSANLLDARRLRVLHRAGSQSVSTRM
jgi:DNA-binding CsgD family transcriptional regulator